jgi:hypothetical protein
MMPGFKLFLTRQVILTVLYIIIENNSRYCTYGGTMVLDTTYCFTNLYTSATTNTAHTVHMVEVLYWLPPTIVVLIFIQKLH